MTKNLQSGEARRGGSASLLSVPRNYTKLFFVCVFSVKLTRVPVTRWYPQGIYMNLSGKKPQQSQPLQICLKKLSFSWKGDLQLHGRIRVQPCHLQHVFAFFTNYAKLTATESTEKRKKITWKVIGPYIVQHFCQQKGKTALSWSCIRFSTRESLQ